MTIGLQRQGLAYRIEVDAIDGAGAVRSIATVRPGPEQYGRGGYLELQQTETQVDPRRGASDQLYPRQLGRLQGKWLGSNFRALRDGRCEIQVVENSRQVDADRLALLPVRQQFHPPFSARSRDALDKGAREIGQQRGKFVVH